VQTGPKHSISPGWRVNAADAGPHAPAPRVVAKFERDLIERSGAQTLQELLDTGIARYFLGIAASG